MHPGEGSSAPDSPKTSYSHICSRNAPSMSVNVGVILFSYHGRSRSTCEPPWPCTLYHRIVSEPTNQAIGCARSTLRSLQTWGSCNPKYCLLSKNASSTHQRRQYPRMTNPPGAVGSVVPDPSSRHCPEGSRTSTTATGSVLLPRYQSTSRITCTRNSRLTLGNAISRSSTGYVPGSPIIASGVGSRPPFLRRRPR